MKRITVFCGASKGHSSEYENAGKALGKYLAERNVEIVFGGGKVGIMGIVADAAIQSGGKVTGVIPGFLKTKEVAHDQLTEMHVVPTMHERKMLMHQISDAVIALPGGYGTLDELFEMLTWAQLGIHAKPIGLLNVNGYFEKLMDFVHHMCDEGFISASIRDMIIVSDDIPTLLEKMTNYIPPVVHKWITDDDI